MPIECGKCRHRSEDDQQNPDFLYIVQRCSSFDFCLAGARLLDFSRTKEASIKIRLLCRPLHLAGIEIVIALGYPNLIGALAELGLLAPGAYTPNPVQGPV
jgi:hypothetical protein